MTHKGLSFKALYSPLRCTRDIINHPVPVDLLTPVRYSHERIVFLCRPSLRYNLSLALQVEEQYAAASKELQESRSDGLKLRRQLAEVDLVSWGMALVQLCKPVKGLVTMYLHSVTHNSVRPKSNDRDVPCCLQTSGSLLRIHPSHLPFVAVGPKICIRLPGKQVYSRE